MKTLWYAVLVLYVHSLAREVVNVHVEIHRHVVFSTRLIWQAAEVPQGWNVPIVVWHFPHLFCSSGVCLAHLHPMHIHTGDKNSVKSHKFMNLCVLTEFLQPRRILISNGAKLDVAPVARAPPLFLPRPELKYIYVLHTSAPPRTYLVCATLLLSPDWRHCTYVIHFSKAMGRFSKFPKQIHH